MCKYASALAVLTLAGTAMGAVGDINSYRVVARNFNDHDQSSLFINGVGYNALNGTPPPVTQANQVGAIAGLGPVQIREDFAAFVPSNGGFANRHLVTFSADNGASNYQFARGESFYVQTTVKIDTAGGLGSPRREAGFTFFNNRTVVDPGPVAATFTDEGYMMVASDGEVAIFGGALPFHSFGSSAYTLGSTATIGFAYYAPGVLGANARVEYLLNGVSSGIKEMTNGSDLSGPTLADPAFGAGGISNYATMGVRAQNQRNFVINDFSDVQYGAVSIIPAPGAAALLGLAGLVAGRRRR